MYLLPCMIIIISNLETFVYIPYSTSNNIAMGNKSHCKCYKSFIIFPCHFLFSRLLVQIHDEMIFEVPDDEVKAVAALLKTSLESLELLGYSLKVPVYLLSLCRL